MTEFSGENVFLVFDIRKSTKYQGAMSNSSRQLVSALSTKAGQLLARGSLGSTAAPRGGDGVLAAYGTLDAALAAIDTLQSEWARAVNDSKIETGAGGSRWWPSFRILITKWEGTWNSIDDSLPPFLKLNSVPSEVKEALPRNAILCGQEVGTAEGLQNRGFVPLLKPVAVRKGDRGSESWRCVVRHDRVRVGGAVFQGSFLLELEEPLSGTEVGIVVVPGLSALTREDVAAIEGTAKTFNVPFQVPPRALLPTIVSEAWQEKNIARRNHNPPMTPEYSGPRVRLVADPKLDRGKLEILVAPLSWEAYSVTIPFPEKPAQPTYIPSDRTLDGLSTFFDSISVTYPAHSSDPVTILDPRNNLCLGLEALVITADDYALFRRRDPTSATGAWQWDGSFSGYAQFAKDWLTADRGLYQVDVQKWAAKEFNRETGATAGNIEDRIRVFGVHWNPELRAHDLLIQFKSDLSALLLAEKLYIDAKVEAERRTWKAELRGPWDDVSESTAREQARKEFERTRETPDSPGTPEIWVHGTRNVFVPFDLQGVRTFLEKYVRSDPDGGAVISEAAATILASLRGTGVMESDLASTLGDPKLWCGT